MQRVRQGHSRPGPKRTPDQLILMGQGQGQCQGQGQGRGQGQGFESDKKNKKYPTYVSLSNGESQGQSLPLR